MNTSTKPKPRPAAPPRAPARSKSEGPVATPKVREGASLGRSARSTAGGAAGQLTPKD